MNPSFAPRTRFALFGRRLLKWAVFGLLFAGFATGAIGLQHARLQQVGRSRPYIDSLALPRTEYAKRLSFGYDMMLADFLYMRSIQAFGGQWKLAAIPEKMMIRFRHYFDVITELDPHFFTAYEFGSMVIGDEGKDYRGSIDLLRKGWMNNPNKYRIPYLAFYTSWYSLKNDKLARLWFERALRAADAPDWLRREITVVDKQTGRRQAAMERWIWEYLDAFDKRDWYRLDAARNHFKNDTDEWNRDVLHKALGRYMNDHNGNMPESLAEMDREGYLRDNEYCDYYRLMEMVQAATRASGHALESFEKIVEEVFVKRSGIPPTPFAPTPVPDYYFLRRDLGPKGAPYAFKDYQMIISRTTARGILPGRLAGVRIDLRQFFLARFRYPFCLEEIFGRKLENCDLETGTWDYNPMMGRVLSSSNPDL